MWWGKESICVVQSIDVSIEGKTLAEVIGSARSVEGGNVEAEGFSFVDVRGKDDKVVEDGEKDDALDPDVAWTAVCKIRRR